MQQTTHQAGQRTTHQAALAIPGRASAGRIKCLASKLLTAGAALLGCLGAAAQDNKPTVAPERRPEPQVTNRTGAQAGVAVPLLDRPLRLADFAGMKPAPALDKQLQPITGFTQQTPLNLHAPTVRTEVYLARTRTALYAVFLCFDPQPAAIRRHLTRRENILTDDYVSLLLDPFADRRRGLLFQVNPLGVEADAIWTENTDPDYSYDQVWDAEAHVTGEGWMALLTIPFASLRFPRGGQEGAAGWGVVLSRNLPRQSETDTWPAISTNVSGTLSQEATLTGIVGATGSHNLQVNPYALAQSVHALNTFDPAQPFFSNRRLAGTAGGDAKAVVHGSLVIDATVNPDFSQVESNQPQFTVNQRYPVYFPELRPFFLENANYFSTPINLVYTRNIVHPEFGARATGKLGRTNLGVLVIDDREPGEATPRPDPLHGRHALYTIARVSEDVARNSSVGLLYTGVRFGPSANHVGGLDFNLRLGEKWNLIGQAVASSTRRLNGSYAAGPAFKAVVTRRARTFSIDNTYRDYAGGFESDSGFIQTSSFRQDAHSLNYQLFPRHSPVQSYGFEENSQIAFDRAGGRLYHYTSADLYATFARKMVVAPIAGQNSDTLSPATYPLLGQPRNFTENFAGGVVKGAPLPQLSLNIIALHGGNVNFNPAAGHAPSLVNQDYVQALVTLQPLGSLTIDNTYLLDRNRTGGGAAVFENQTLRTKINYQFTRALSARVIVEYDSLLVNPAETSLVRTKQVATQALLTWLPHPGTAIYLGYNNDLQNLDHGLCTRLPGGACDPNAPVLARSNGYLNDGRQFFIKASYLLRF